MSLKNHWQKSNSTTQATVLLDYIEDLVFVLDKKCSIVNCNAAVRKFLQKETDQIIGHKISDFSTTECLAKSGR